jgi:hypothetical protein
MKEKKKEIYVLNQLLMKYKNIIKAQLMKKENK